jgi:hypothetical protein
MTAAAGSWQPQLTHSDGMSYAVGFLFVTHLVSLIPVPASNAPILEEMSGNAVIL